MIFINETKIKVEQFPNGELRIPSLNGILLVGAQNTIRMYYESDTDLMALWFIKKHSLHIQVLEIMYMPYSRMDRTQNNSVFTLKYVADFINTLNFHVVKVLGAHSDVTPALLNNCKQYDVIDQLVRKAEQYFGEQQDFVYVYPDAGAAKRYSTEKHIDTIICNKKRDFATGKISSLQMSGDTLKKHKYAIIIDDLCSYGGTFDMTAIALCNSYADIRIALVVTHCEKSIEKGNLLKEDSKIEKIFTTRSMGEVVHEKISYYNELNEGDIFND